MNNEGAHVIMCVCERESSIRTGSSLVVDADVVSVRFDKVI